MRRGEKYPGFCLRYCNHECGVYENINGTEQIIEVYGDLYLVEDKIWEEECFKQDIIAVLKKGDAELYWKLQWLNPMRWHPSIQMIVMPLCIMLWVVLSIVHVILGVYFLPELFSLRDLFVIIFTSILFSFLELIVCILVFRMCQVSRGIFKVLVHILKDKDVKKEKWTYYKNLFQELSKAYYKDKARAARLMSWVMLFVPR